MLTKINQYNYNIQPKCNNSIHFYGLKNKSTKSMFVFDLDGTLATASSEQMQDIMVKAKSCNANIVYATGRTYKEFTKLQNEIYQKGINFPNPDYLIANNGQFLYENINGLLSESNMYQNQLQGKTRYNRDTVTNLMKMLSQNKKYKYSDKELTTLSNLKEIKESDPTFYNSRISYYEWNPSKNMAEYFIAHDVNIKELENEVNSALEKGKIKLKFRENHYTKPIMDACNDRILLQANNLRRHKDGSMTALFLCAADKSDGIEFIRKNKGIKYSEILIAGNDDNDIPMAKLSKKGAKFICLKDASERLIKFCLNLKNNVFIASTKGADAILEGIKHFKK